MCLWNFKQTSTWVSIVSFPIPLKESSLGPSSSSSSAFDWLHQVFSPVDVTNWTVLRRSAAVPHSLASSVVSIGQICFRMWLCNVQSCRTWAGVWSAIRQSHIEDSAMLIFFRCALNPQCPALKRKIVLCSGRLRLFNGHGGVCSRLSSV